MSRLLFGKNILRWLTSFHTASYYRSLSLKHASTPTVSYMVKVKTYPVGDHRATWLFYGDLGKWAYQVWSKLEELGQFPLTHTSTQCFNDFLAVQVPLADRLDLNLLSHYNSFGLLPLSRLALEVKHIINSYPWQSINTTSKQYGTNLAL